LTAYVADRVERLGMIHSAELEKRAVAAVFA